jgi:hypothetical protein
MSHLPDYIKYNSKHAKTMCEFDQYKGKTVSIFGAGPSLLDIDKVPFTHQAWACNSALPWLKDNTDLRITHGFCIDQGPEMLKEWLRTFDVKYLVSSSINPQLTDHLLREKRKLVWFHNHLGITNPEGYEGRYELDLYRYNFPTSVSVGHGLNAVPRAVCLAMCLGFKKAYVYGADCSARPDYKHMPHMDTKSYAEWMKGLVLYADGRNALECYGENSPFVEAPDLNGRRWHTRPDMVVSAQHLLDLEKAYPGRIELVGDTLPNALRGVTENLPTLNPNGTVEGFGRAA